VTSLTSERVRVSVPRPRLWEVFEDPAALARVLPGCESLEADGPGRYRGVLATRLQFLTLRADATAVLRDLRPPDALTLVLDGRPRGLAGSFSATIPIRLDEVSESVTDVEYEVDLAMTGRLAAFGTPILRDTMRRQVRELVANVEALVASETGGASG
jgi:carbon monoxide dehydrogenase subunit G